VHDHGTDHTLSKRLCFVRGGGLLFEIGFQLVDSANFTGDCSLMDTDTTSHAAPKLLEMGG
jgi:hypothetical protein